MLLTMTKMLIQRSNFMLTMVLLTMMLMLIQRIIFMVFLLTMMKMLIQRIIVMLMLLQMMAMLIQRIIFMLMTASSLSPSSSGRLLAPFPFPTLCRLMMLFYHTIVIPNVERSFTYIQLLVHFSFNSLPSDDTLPFAPYVLCTICFLGLYFH